MTDMREKGVELLRLISQDPEQLTHEEITDIVVYNVLLQSVLSETGRGGGRDAYGNMERVRERWWKEVLKKEPNYDIFLECPTKPREARIGHRNRKGE
ncbi:MAG: hypothetical protein PHV42_03510 [Candidatus Pacebacteria bacterium]|nr:hypothetical protein [Candidatus Paceibacterota bacterium]